jgi:sulfopropanediol 3-dehydrogenase
MSTYLKKANKKIEETQSNTRDIVKDILDQIRNHGESAVRELAARFDSWTRDFILSQQEIDALIDMVPRRAKDDIRFAYEQVYGFAVKQRESMQAFETELLPGVTLGQRLIPCQCAGCYVPGGRFSHAASAIMSVATAKAAGVPLVVACTPPRGDSINPTVAYALSLCGADVIMALGGVQAIGTMAFGLFTGSPADIILERSASMFLPARQNP